MLPTIITQFLYEPLTNRARGQYWEILARGRGSTDRAKRGLYKNDRGPIFPSTARVSWFSKYFIIWHAGHACFEFGGFRMTVSMETVRMVKS